MNRNSSFELLEIMTAVTYDNKKDKNEDKCSCNTASVHRKYSFKAIEQKQNLTELKDQSIKVVHPVFLIRLCYHKEHSHKNKTKANKCPSIIRAGNHLLEKNYR